MAATALPRPPSLPLPPRPKENFLIKGKATGPAADYGYQSLIFPSLSYSRSLQGWVADKRGRKLKPDMRQLYRLGIRDPVLSTPRREATFQARLDIVDERSLPQPDLSPEHELQAPVWRATVTETQQIVPSLDDLKLTQYRWRRAEPAQEPLQQATDPMYRYTYGEAVERACRSVSPQRNPRPSPCASPRRPQRSLTSLEFVKSLVTSERRNRSPRRSQAMLVPEEQHEDRPGCLYSQLQKSMVVLKSAGRREGEEERPLSRERGRYKPFVRPEGLVPAITAPALRQRDYRSIEPYQRLVSQNRSIEALPTPKPVKTRRKRRHNSLENDPVHLVMSSNNPAVSSAGKPLESLEELPDWGNEPN